MLTGRGQILTEGVPDLYRSVNQRDNLGGPVRPKQAMGGIKVTSDCQKSPKVDWTSVISNLPRTPSNVTVLRHRARTVVFLDADSWLQISKSNKQFVCKRKACLCLTFLSYKPSSPWWKCCQPTTFSLCSNPCRTYKTSCIPLCPLF